MIDFLLQYDKTDPFCHKIVVKQVERDADDFSDEDQPMGDIKGDNLSEGPDFSGNLTAREPGGALYKKSQTITNESSKDFEGGEEISPAETKKRYKEVEEVTFPSLDEALNMKFDLNNVTNIQ